jgi:hypothetical protein
MTLASQDSWHKKRPDTSPATTRRSEAIACCAQPTVLGGMRVAAPACYSAAAPARRFHHHMSAARPRRVRTPRRAALRDGGGTGGDSDGGAGGGTAARRASYCARAVAPMQPVSATPPRRMCAPRRAAPRECAGDDGGGGTTAAAARCEARSARAVAPLQYAAVALYASTSSREGGQVAKRRTYTLSGCCAHSSSSGSQYSEATRRLAPAAAHAVVAACLSRLALMTAMLPCSIRRATRVPSGATTARSPPRTCPRGPLCNTATTSRSGSSALPVRQSMCHAAWPSAMNMWLKPARCDVSPRHRVHVRCAGQHEPVPGMTSRPHAASRAAYHPQRAASSGCSALKTRHISCSGTRPFQQPTNSSQRTRNTRTCRRESAPAPSGRAPPSQQGSARSASTNPRRRAAGAPCTAAGPARPCASPS